MTFGTAQTKNEWESGKIAEGLDTSDAKQRQTTQPSCLVDVYSALQMSASTAQTPSNPER